MLNTSPQMANNRSSNFLFYHACMIIDTLENKNGGHFMSSDSCGSGVQ